jgi:hypothetical protein
MMAMAVQKCHGQYKAESQPCCWVKFSLENKSVERVDYDSFGICDPMVQRTIANYRATLPSAVCSSSCNLRLQR